MRLTRRDALAVLGVTAAGATVAADTATDGAIRAAVLGDADDREPLPADTRTTMTAAAEVLYPSEAEGIASFVESYARGRLAADPDRRPDVIDTAIELDDAAEAFHNDAFGALPPAQRDATLRSLGVNEADPVPDGTVPERIRYYVVNDLLYAFYASPAGGELVGNPNPIGYPGGYRTALSPDNRRADPDDPTDPTDDTPSTDDLRNELDSTDDTPSADDLRGEPDPTDDTPPGDNLRGESDG